MNTTRSSTFGLLGLLLIGCPDPASETPTPMSDLDGDGVSPADGDCNDASADISPFATDLFGDGVDQNCDGADGIDGDGDGFANEVSGGNDCDDADPAIFPEATDVVGDGIDQNCDGIDGVDRDGDGQASLASGGEDCDDNSATVGVGFADTVGNGVDENCDGTDGVDGDGDGVAGEASGGTDCDDANPNISPNVIDLVGDGIDNDCDGLDGDDDDGDGQASVASGGLDCDDTRAAVGNGFPDTAGDGIDSNCDGADGVDSDGDMVADLASGGTDCNDTDPTISPMAIDTVGNAIDDNCDGIDGVDGDQDGFASMASGGTDCDDTDGTLHPGIDGDADGVSICDDCDDADPLRFPGNPETCDTVDEDCDGTADFTGPIDACAREDAGLVGSGQLDALFVVDNSGSMQEEQALLANAAGSFLTPLVDNYELHVGVVTTDMFDAGQSGRLQPGPDGSLFIDEVDDLTSATSWLSATLPQGTTGAGIEQPLEATVAALDTLATTHNAGFARATAELAVIFITDEDADSVLTPTDWQTWFDGYITGRPVATAHAIVHATNSQNLEDVASANAGLIFDLNNDGLTAALNDIALAIEPAGDNRIPLSDLPDVSTITVSAIEPGGQAVGLVDGVDYVYDATLNAILLTGYDPVGGTELVVTYRAVP